MGIRHESDQQAAVPEKLTHKVSRYACTSKPINQRSVILTTHRTPFTEYCREKAVHACPCYTVLVKPTLFAIF